MNNTHKGAGMALGMMALFAANVASAHVVVKPATAGVGSFTSFSMGVPSEKDAATVSVRLMLPAGLSYVTPNVKPGWTISEKTDMGTGAVTEIDWTGGTIPSKERDEFMFSAQVPATETTLAWKAYQTYSDGSVVAWDAAPVAKGSGAAETTPYSTTKVVNDLAAAPAPVKDRSGTALTISLVALVFSVIAFSRTRVVRKAEQKA